MTKKAKETKRSALGKGLDALLAGNVQETPTDSEHILEVPLTQIRPNPNQPRVAFEESAMSELKASMEERGILQPILLRPIKDGYQIVAGERRWRAANALQWTSIPSIVKEMDDSEAVEIALVENLQREDLNPLEAARALKYLADEFRLTQEEIAERIGKERSTVANSMRLLQLPEEIQAMLSRGELSAGHARALLRLGSVQLQKEYARKTVEKGLSVRALEQMTADQKGDSASLEKKKSPPRDADLAFVEDRLQRLLGQRVRIRGSQDKGKVEIRYESLTDLNAIIKRLES